MENLRQTRHGKERVLAEKRPKDSVRGYLQRKFYTYVGMIFMNRVGLYDKRRGKHVLYSEDIGD